MRCVRPYATLFLLTLIAGPACDSNTPTTPTPAPAPTPAPTPTPTPTPPPTPSAPAALEAITLSDSTVPSQGRPVVTIRLTAPAPTGNASISLESSNPDVAKVPSNISVAAGQTSNTFTIDTATVRDSTAVTITARYEGVTMTAGLTIVPPALSPQFSVSSTSRGGDSCAITGAGGTVDCQFDASRSTGFVATYRWTLTIAGKERVINQPEGSAVFTPLTDCTFLSGGTLNSEGTESLRIALRLEDRQGNVTSAVERTVRLYPNGLCGY